MATTPASSSSSTELLAAVLADPDDDAARAVYADALQELGDPRGELIALQLAHARGEATPEMRERERVLVERHGADQLGPLAAVVDSFELRRGFVASCTVDLNRAAYNLARVAGHPLWATVEQFSGPPALYFDPALRSLRSLAVPVAEFDALADDPLAHRLAALEITGGRHEPWRNVQGRWPDWSRFTTERWPRLRELRLHCLANPEDLEQLAEMPIAGQLERVAACGSRPWRLRDWLTTFERVRPARDLVIEHARPSPGHTAFVFDGSTVHLDIVTFAGRAEIPQFVAEVQSVARPGTRITCEVRTLPEYVYAYHIDDYAPLREFVVARGGSFRAP